ncbi:MAG: sugar phosphate isomerase/epimerase [Caldilineaceae bacterium]|nr:sugar phosphate isomerase/epimerase [Caldilineaceae bacterium]MBP8107692.1 sugar phosphate isomerase/epimerase [Caldilineaceae bacterium]MBP8122886.1 sugar phosphate isomerase/epimerase [Caldilineaceae bacterium]MBP9072273.1 sugar phosphate isomerase/epimerase [Caldilineaceae bacterium]
MRLGIFTKTFARPTLDGILDAVVAHGLPCTHFNMACVGLPSMPDEIDPDLARQIQAAHVQRGLKMAGISGTYNMIHPDVAVRADGLRRLAVLAQAAPLMGTAIITLCTGTRDAVNPWRHHPHNARPQAWADLCREMAQALTIAETHGLILGVEPELGNVVNSAVQARRLLDEMRSPHLQIVLDGANLLRPETVADQAAILDAALDLLGDDLIMAHAKDITLDGRHVAAGMGVLDYAHFVGGLQEIGFAGPLILHGLAEEQVGDAVRFVRGAMG